jgi:hypothetical protein
MAITTALGGSILSIAGTDGEILIPKMMMQMILGVIVLVEILAYIVLMIKGWFALDRKSKEISKKIADIIYEAIEEKRAELQPLIIKAVKEKKDELGPIIAKAIIDKIAQFKFKLRG